MNGCYERGRSGMSGERARLACWSRRLAATNFQRCEHEESRPVCSCRPPNEVRDGGDAIASTRDARAPRTRRGAFTFVEILASLAFLGIVIPVVVSALMVSNRAANVAERSTIAVQLGENRLSQITLDSSWTTESDRGDFGAEWPGYRWELTKADWESGAMTELTLSVIFQVQGREHDVRLGTLVNESLTPQ